MSCGQCITCVDAQPLVAGMRRSAMMFCVCEKCGNKRCPHATDCRWGCTGSNEPGQPGSVYQ